MIGNISFQSLLPAILSLETAEKQQIWELLEAELFPDDKDSPEDIAEIQAARDDYQAGNYTTFDRYIEQRADRSA
jgi:hypothetical protein